MRCFSGSSLEKGHAMFC
jgi:hypothetical protein